MIRAAADDEVEVLASLLAAHRDDPHLVVRSASDLRRHRNEFLLAWASEGAAVGCVAVHDHGRGLFELLTLAVSPHAQGTGVGSALVEEALSAATGRGAERVFAITARPGYFERFEFRRVRAISVGVKPLLTKARQALSQPLPNALRTMKTSYVFMTWRP